MPEKKRKLIPPVYLYWGGGVAVFMAAAVTALVIYTGGYGGLWYAAAVNVVTFAFYGYDKRAAAAEGRRTPEAILHLLALLGAAPAAMLGQRVFRHKTRKVRFQAVFWAIVAAHVALAAWGAYDRLGVQGRNAAAWMIAVGAVLIALNGAGAWLEPQRGKRKLSAIRALTIVAGGAIGAALRDMRRAGVAWLPYVAGAAHLAAILVAEYWGLRAFLN